MSAAVLSVIPMPIDDTTAVLATHIQGLISAAGGLVRYDAEVKKLAAALCTAFESGNKLITCGNGGSAAEAAHLAEEFTGRFKRERRSLPGICLAIDGTVLTCIANDYGFDQVFSRQISSIGAPGDVLAIFSTSGNSPNLVRAVHEARNRGMHVVALLGHDGGALKGLSDYEFLVPSTDSARVQECHLLLVHAICDAVERRIVST